jgi:Ulp1 protease family, C-terminal catalytic domain
MDGPQMSGLTLKDFTTLSLALEKKHYKAKSNSTKTTKKKTLVVMATPTQPVSITFTFTEDNELSHDAALPPLPLFETITSDSAVIDLTAELSEDPEKFAMPNDSELAESAYVSYRLDYTVQPTADISDRDHLLALRDGRMINDEVVNPFLGFIWQYWDDMYHRHPAAKGVMIYDTFFFPLLHKGDNWVYDFVDNEVRSTSKYNVNIFSGFANLFVPIIEGMHCTYFRVDMLKKKLYYYDSLSSKGITVVRDTMNTYATYLVRYIRDLAARVWDEKSFIDGWKVELVVEGPQQHNFVDCGVFMCAGIDFEVSGLPWVTQRPTQENMDNYRNVILSSILSKNKKLPYTQVVATDGFYQGVPLKPQLRTDLAGGGALDLTLKCAIKIVFWRIFHLMARGVITNVFWVGPGGGCELINLMLMLFKYLDRKIYERLSFVAAELIACDTFHKNCFTVLTKELALYSDSNKCPLDVDFKFYGSLWYLMGFDATKFKHDFFPISSNSSSLFYSVGAINPATYLELIIEAVVNHFVYFFVAKCWAVALGPYFRDHVNVEVITDIELAQSNSAYQLAFFQVPQDMKFREDLLK